MAAVRGDAKEAAQAEDEYCTAVQKLSRVFGKQRRSNSTADEHKMYMRIIDEWMVRQGFGSFVEAEIDESSYV